MNLSERPRIRALVRADEFDRFVSVLVFVPKERYDTDARRRIGEFLAGIFEGRLSAAYPAYPEGPLARTHYIIGRDEGKDAGTSRAKRSKGHRRRSCAPGRTPCVTRSMSASADPSPRTRLTLRQRVQRRLSGSLQRRRGDRRRRDPRTALRSSAPRRRPVPPRRRRRDPRPPEGLFARVVVTVVGAGAASGKSRLPRRQRAHLPRRLHRRDRQGQGLAARHDLERASGGASKSMRSRISSKRPSWPFSAGLRNPTHSTASSSRQVSVGGRRDGARTRALPAPDPHPVRAGLSCGNACPPQRNRQPRSWRCSTPGSTPHRERCCAR